MIPLIDSTFVLKIIDYWQLRKYKLVANPSGAENELTKLKTIFGEANK